MMPSVYNRLGPYDIRQEIGRGGMAVVFLATDTRNDQQVALRSVPHYSGQDVLDAERRGAELQEQFCQVSSYVPKVFDHGSEAGYFYVAMEYLEGENLSQVIRRGPVSTERAVAIAIELCKFLEDARGFAWNEGGRDFRHLLHGDLTPVNIRIMPGDAVKVLDFGIAKALSLSRKVTRNDFGNVAYLSPERIESGGVMDATDGFWALGVMLYEMLRGAPPFSAPDTRALERAIVARNPVPLPMGLCPAGLHAVVAKLLGPKADDRYQSADAIRADLERVQAGRQTDAEKEGWPGRAGDEPATRRMSPAAAAAVAAGAAATEEVTRRTVPPPLPPSALETPTRPTSPVPPKPAGPEPITTPRGAGQRPGAGAAPKSVPGPGRPTPPPLPRAARPPATPMPLHPALAYLLRVTSPARIALAVMLVIIVGNEILVGRAAGRVANTVPSQELSALDDRWGDYQRLAARSVGPATWRLERMLKQRTISLTDRMIASYREGLSVVWSAQWTSARQALVRAVAADPDSSVLNGALRYVDGHLHRINGDELRRDRKQDSARREFASAVTAFRESAQMRPDWPDPFIGLARTFLTGLGDVDRGADALEQARRLGYAPGERDTAQLADSYVERGDALWQTSRDLRPAPQERDHLGRAVAAYQRALELYGGITGYTGVPANVRRTQGALERVQRRLDELDWASLVHDPGPLDFGANSNEAADVDHDDSNAGAGADADSDSDSDSN
jgi:serine/threonine protein kinase